MPMRNLIPVLFLVQALTVLIAGTSANDVVFSSLTNRDGISQNSVTAILQDRTGFIWLGTQNGLNRYDGHKFSIYKHDPYNPQSLSHNWVLSMVEDEKGYLWIGTHDGGLNRFDPDTGQCLRFNQRNNPGLPNDRIWALMIDQNRTLWIGHGEGLSRLDLTAAGYDFHFYQSEKGQGPDRAVNALYEDRTSQVWIGTFGGGGLWKYLPDQDGFEATPGPWRGPGRQRKDRIKALYEDEEGTLWVGTWGAGLIAYHPETGKVQEFRFNPDDPNSLANNIVLSILQDPQNQMWIGTHSGGLNRLNRETGHFDRYVNEPANLSSIADNWITTIFRDRSDIMWFGTGRGLSKMIGPYKAFERHHLDPQNPNSLSGNTIKAVFKDRQGMLWIGIWGAGLNRYNPETGEYRHFRQQQRQRGSLANDNVWALHGDRFGRLWVGTSQGLNLWQPETENFRWYGPQNSGLSAFNISALLEDRQGRLWVGSWGAGLNISPLVADNKLAFTTIRANHDQIDGLSNDTITRIYEDRSGQIWVATTHGLNRWLDGDLDTPQFERFENNPEDRNSLSHNYISCMYEDEDGVYWLGTDGGGLNRFDPHANRFQHFLEEDGLADNAVMGILPDDRGILWISTGKGLCKFDPVSGHFRTYDLKDGLPDNEFSQAFHKTDSGKLYFGGEQGLVGFYPGDLKDNPHIPPIVFTGFKKFNREVVLEKDISKMKELILSYKDYSFSFDFAALDFHDPEKNRYAYRLDQISQDWIDLGTRSFIDFNNLSPGEYLLRIKGSNNDGLWNEAGANLKITIKPPMWRSNWAYAGYIIFLITTGTGIHFYRLNRVRVRERQLEALVSERSAEIQEKNRELMVQEKMASLGTLTAGIAHEIKNPLNFISNFAEVTIDLSSELKESWHQNKDHPDEVGDLLDDLEKNAMVIHKHGQRATSIVENMMSLVQGSSGKRLEVELNHLVKEYADLAVKGRQVREKHFDIRLDEEYDPGIGSMKVMAQNLGRVIINLINNAIDALTEKKETSTEAFQPHLRIFTKATQQHVEIGIRDNGPGIHQENLEEIFNPFFTSKKTGSGHIGLGLSICYDIVVQEHNGMLKVNSRFGQFTEFLITLPKPV